MQKKIFLGGKFYFLRKKGDFSDVFSAFYGQHSVTAAWATRSPWSIGPGGLRAPCVLACAMHSLAIVITIVQSFSPFFLSLLLHYTVILGHNFVIFSTLCIVY